VIQRLLEQAAHRFSRPYRARRRTAVDPQDAKEQRRRERAEHRALLLAAKQRAAAQRKLRRQEAAARALAASLARDTAAARAYEHYLRVREWAAQMREASASVSLTATERRLVEALAPLWDAAPQTIASLRRWCEPISGVRASDYEVGSSGLAKRIRCDLKRLYMEVGRELFVPEPPLLGGFGFETDAQRYNDDTVKFFNVLVGLQDGGVLGGIRGAAHRQVVWEIGGGWGGFAYQFKTLYPNTTYVVTGAPELLLVSAVYLMTVFPGARCRLYGESSSIELSQQWEEMDFIFAPEAALSDLRPPRLDLALDVMALRQMSAERCRSHVQWASDRGCRYFYSLHPGGFSYEDLPAAWTAIGRSYWLHPVAPRLELSKVAEVYSHLVGWKRLRV
jgi:hypothetical protein